MVETDLGKFESPLWVVDKAELIDHLSNGGGELVVVTFFLGHVGEQVINEGHEEGFIFI